MQEDKKKQDGKKKNCQRGFEPATIRLVTCSLNDYATQHLTLNGCNCYLFKSDLQPASWLT